MLDKALITTAMALYQLAQSALIIMEQLPVELVHSNKDNSIVSHYSKKYSLYITFYISHPTIVRGIEIGPQ